MLISHRVLTWSLVAALTGGAMSLSVPAQAAPTSADPTDAQAIVPSAVYQSPFVGVRKLNDAVLGDWRLANERLLSRGAGHAASSPAGAVPKPDPHAGHSHSSK